MKDLFAPQAVFGSAAMAEAVARWRGIYEGRVGEGQDGCLRLGYTIIRKLSRAIFAEYEPRGALAALPHQEAMEKAMICGESYLKPLPGGWMAVDRQDVTVYNRDAFGEPTDVELTERLCRGRFWYTLLERRTLQLDKLTVTNRLFRAGSQGELGREVPLNALEEYAQLPAKFTLNSPGNVGLVRVKMPMSNCVDGSREGISVFAPIEGLLEAIAENEHQLRQEFRNGASRLVVSRDLLDRGQLKDSLFVALDESPDSLGITVFNPQLREQSYLNRQQAYLRAVENAVGLKRGLLSQVEAVDRTATEITSSEGEYMTTILELRRAWEKAAKEALLLSAELEGRDYQEPEFQWGDGVV